MVSASRPVSKARRAAAIARITLAVMLTLVLLAGVAPFTSLSSSSHECGMACCAGKPSHLAGSCSTAFSTEEEAETPAATEDEHSAHGHMAHSSSETSPAKTSAKQHGAAKSSSAHHSTRDGKSPRTVSVASQAVTTPCSPECAAAAISSSQVRRPRDPASPMVTVRLRPPTLSLFVRRFTIPIPKSAEARRLSHPRAPPSHLKQLSA